jgi:hypothetical protein
MPARAIVLSSCSAWINIINHYGGSQMEVKKNGGDVAKMRADENMKAELADQNAKIDYLAMMADIEFPEAGDSATSTEESEEE